MSKLRAKALIAQGGGPTAVINQSLVSIIIELKKYPEIEKIYGSRHGVSGIKKEDFLDLTDVSLENLELVANTPSSALGSTRDKPDSTYCAQMFVAMQKYNIGYFFLIGGNDGASVCDIVNQEAKKVGYELRVIHVPKTIDNDLLVNDHTPGFGSAAKFVAQAFMGVNFDNASLPGVYIGVVMGRHAGFLTASSILAKQTESDGPHLIYTPEKVFNVHHFVRDVKEIYEKYGRCVVAVSEGIVNEEGVPIATKLAKQVEHDAHGNVQLSGTGILGDLLADTVKSLTGISRVRVDTFGYLQRSFVGCVSEVDAKEAREVGYQAVKYALSGDVDGSVVIKRTGDYEINYELVDLSQVAHKTKSMPEEFFISDSMVSEAFINYVKPLAGELPRVGKLEVIKVK
ncbi:MAG TPA: 6-phosphofructokinase [Candidatus Magasanikbacteria bacterium]|nr:6-phosphofructokinase [Candidatus Magasanikbacteria bacterium]